MIGIMVWLFDRQMDNLLFLVVLCVAMLMHFRCQAAYSSAGRYVGAGSADDGVHKWNVQEPDMCSSLHVCQSVFAPGMTAGGHMHTRNTRRHSE